MDGVSVAASIIAVLGFATSSTKFIHDVISGIGDGPNSILQTTSVLEDLQKILTQISSLNAGLTPMSMNLLHLIEQCAADLKTFEKKIGCLRLLPAEKRIGKVWKMFKNVLTQDDFKKMWENIDRHIAALSLQLQM